MVSFATTTVFGVDWIFLKPYIVLGLALGSVYALSGVGIVVLYQATGVLNLAFGAIGAAGALISYYLVNHTSTPHWIAYLACVVFGAIESRYARSAPTIGPSSMVRRVFSFTPGGLERNSTGSPCERHCTP